MAFFNTFSLPQSRRRACRSSLSGLLPVESRVLLAAITVTTTPNSVVITGTDASDSITIVPAIGGYSLSSPVVGTLFKVNGGADQSTVQLTASQLDFLTVDLGKGADTAVFQGIVSSTLVITDKGDAADLNQVTIQGGTLGSVSATFENGIGRLALDAQATTMSIVGDVNATFTSMTSAEVLYATSAATGKINQSGILTVTSSASSTDKVTVDANSGTISLNGLTVDLGSGNDSLTIKAGTTLTQPSTWKMGAGSDTILAQKLNAQAITIDDADPGAIGDVNSVTFLGGTLAGVDTTFNSGTATLTFDAQANSLSINGDVAFTNNGSKLGTVQYFGGTDPGVSKIVQGGLLKTKSPAAAPTKLVLDAQSGEIRIGGTSLTFGSNADSIVIRNNVHFNQAALWDLGAGDDLVDIVSMISQPLSSSLDIKMQGGNDRVLLTNVSTSSLRIDSGAENDFVRIQGGSSNYLQLDSSGSVAQDIVGPITINGAVQVNNTAATGPTKVSVLNAVTINGVLQVKSAGSDDQLLLDGGDGKVSIGSISADLGAGADQILVRNAINVEQSSRWSLGPGSDLVDLHGDLAKFTTIPALDLLLGSGFDQVTLNGLEVGALKLSSDSTDSTENDTIKIAAGKFGSVTAIYEKTSLALQVDSANVSGDTQMIVRGNSSSRLSITGGVIGGRVLFDSRYSSATSGNSSSNQSIDLIQLDGGSGSLTIGSVIVNTGALDDTVQITGKVEVLGSTLIDAGIGNDRVSILGTDSGKMVALRQSVGVRLGSGIDSLDVNLLQSDSVATLDTGAGNDSAIIRNSKFSSTASLLLDSGVNTALLDSSQFAGLVTISGVKESKTTLIGSGGLEFARYVTIKLYEGSVDFSGATPLIDKVFKAELKIQGTKTRIPVNLGSVGGVGGNKPSKLILVKAFEVQ